MKVVFRFDGSEALRRRVEPHGVVMCPESDDADYLRLLPETEVLWHVLKPVTAGHIGGASRLKLIQKIGSGVNTIALDAAKARGIAVCNLPGTNSRAVAEMALLLMLACLRRLRDLDAAVRRDWTGAWALQDRFGEIGGRTVGLVGFGEVAKLLAQTLAAMGANVIYTARTRKEGVPYAWRSLEELLAEADIVSLHLPLTAETGRLIDPRRMKPGAILVNTARGGLVDEAGLVEALASGRLAAAGLDVFAEEPLPAASPLLDFANVVVSPHLAWLTQETLERSLALALENVRRLSAGEPLLHRVA